MSDFGYKLAKKILKPIFYKKCDPTVLNAEVVPKEGPIVLCGNHMHVLDQCGPLFEIPRVVHYMAKKEYFDSFKTRWFFRMVGCISVDRENHEEAKKAKEKAISILKKGGAIGIFPEGTRNKTDAFLLPFKYGAVSMAKKTDATIVPFAVTNKKKKGGNLMVRFGEPFKVTDMTLEEANDKLFNVIKSLMNLKIVFTSIQKSEILYTGFGTTAPMSAGITTFIAHPIS